MGVFENYFHEQRLIAKGWNCIYIVFVINKNVLPSQIAPRPKIRGTLLMGGFRLNGPLFFIFDAGDMKPSQYQNWDQRPMFGKVGQP